MGQKWVTNAFFQTSITIGNPGLAGVAILRFSRVLAGAVMRNIKPARPATSRWLSYRTRRCHGQRLGRGHVQNTISLAHALTTTRIVPSIYTSLGHLATVRRTCNPRSSHCVAEPPVRCRSRRTRESPSNAAHHSSRGSTTDGSSGQRTPATSTSWKSRRITLHAVEDICSECHNADPALGQPLRALLFSAVIPATFRCCRVTLSR